nr:DNA mismatch repair protein MutL [Chitinophagaceae bacterium]
GSEKQTIEDLLEQYKNFSSEVKFSSREKIIRSLAKQQAIKPGTSLSVTEMHQLIADLFDCEMPNSTADGQPTYLSFSKEQLERMFGK